MDDITIDHLIMELLADLNQAVAEQFSGDVLFLSAPLIPPTDSYIREEVENLKALSLNAGRETTSGSGLPEGDVQEGGASRLVVMLETDGGYIEPTERIVAVFREHYEIVEFIVPSHAYSAGTVLAMSGDEIHMDYYSVLGPIDPQFPADGNMLVSGVGYLAKFEELLAAVNSAPDMAEAQAEMSYLIAKFDPAVLSSIEQSREYSKSLLVEWLPQYKFKDWDITKTSRTQVTEGMRRQRAEQIAEILGNPNRWHSHGRGISLRELGSEEIKLEIQNYGKNPRKAIAVKNYYNNLKDFMFKNAATAIIHTQPRTRRIS